MAYRIDTPSSAPAAGGAGTRKPTSAPAPRAGMTGRKIAVGVAAVLALAGGAAGYRAMNPAKPKFTPPDAETMRAERERLRDATPEERQAFMEARRAEFAAMTPDERRARGEAMRAGREARERGQMKEYFALDAAGRQTMLDEDIDRRVAMAERGGPGGFGGPRGPRGQDGPRSARPDGDRPADANNTDRPAGPDGERRRERREPTEAQRNEFMRRRLDNTDPVERAQRERYRADLQARAAARGIALPMGPGGGRGPGR